METSLPLKSQIPNTERLLSLVSVPAMASDIAAGIRLAVEYDINTGILKLSGTMSEVAGRNWATFYLLNPGKTRDDIPSHTMQDPVFSHCGEFNAKKDLPKGREQPLSLRSPYLAFS